MPHFLSGQCSVHMHATSLFKRKTQRFVARVQWRRSHFISSAELKATRRRRAALNKSYNIEEDLHCQEINMHINKQTLRTSPLKGGFPL
jgi:hypothetical protein